MDDIRRISRGEAREAAALLGRAFSDSPAYEALLSDLAPARRDPARERVKRGFVEAAVRYQVPSGIWVSGRLTGVSLVFEAGQYPPGLGAQLWAAAGCLTTGPRSIARFLRVQAYAARRHPPEPHDYLFALGVDPLMQGRGLGKALLSAMAERADARRVACYLETDKETNVRIYRAAGYEVVTEGMIPGADFRMWTMLRPARR